MTSAPATDACLTVKQPPATPNLTHTCQPDDSAKPTPTAPLTPMTDPIITGTPPLPATAKDTEDEEDEVNEDIFSSLERDHPTFSKATISLIVQFLPEDGHPEGRLALIAVKSHNLPPMTTVQRMATLAPLPYPLTTLLQQWENALPEALSQRALSRAKEQEAKRLKEAEQKSQRAAAKRPDSKITEKPKPTPTRTAHPTPTAETPSTGPVPTASQADLF